MKPTRPTPIVDRRGTRALAAGLALVLLAVPAALASDGAIEINQARALAGGVTPGDAPGFPVTLSVPGSYRLTSNLDLTVAPDPKNTSGILVEADGISIDLNGFAIMGEVVCTAGASVTCTPSGGTGYGIDGDAGTFPLVIASEVSNGSIIGMGAGGLLAWRAQGITAQSNGDVGVDAFLVRDTVGLLNGNHGVSAAVATSSLGFANGANGIWASTVLGSGGFSNFGSGVVADLVAQSFASHNKGAGILGELVQESVAFSNTGYGIQIDVPARGAIGSSVLYNNNSGGDQTNATHELGDNLCDGGVCP